MERKKKQVSELHAIVLPEEMVNPARIRFYNPRTKETRLDTEALRKRLTQGAQPTDVVRTLLEKGGLLEKIGEALIAIGKAKLEKEKIAKAKAKEDE